MLGLLRSAADRDALWVGLTDGSLDLVATDHVPDRVGIEKAEAAKGISFDRISNGAPGIETLLALVHSEGVAREHLTLERMVDLLSTTPAARFGLTPERAARLPGDALIMHPGPMNRGVEIAPEVADRSNAVITNQGANGVAVRMAVLYRLLGSGVALSGGPSPERLGAGDTSPERLGAGDTDA